MSRLADATRAHDAALQQLATVYADEIQAGGGNPRDVIEALELLRGQLHHGADDLIDAVELTYPPVGNAWRSRRHCELQVPTS